MLKHSYCTQQPCNVRQHKLTKFIEHSLEVVKDGGGLFLGIRHARAKLSVLLAIDLDRVVAVVEEEGPRLGQQTAHLALCAGAQANIGLPAHHHVLRGAVLVTAWQGRRVVGMIMLRDC